MLPSADTPCARRELSEPRTPSDCIPPVAVQRNARKSRDASMARPTTTEPSAEMASAFCAAGQKTEADEIGTGGSRGDDKEGRGEEERAMKRHEQNSVLVSRLYGGRQYPISARSLWAAAPCSPHPRPLAPRKPRFRATVDRACIAGTSLVPFAVGKRVLGRAAVLDIVPRGRD